MAGLKGANLRVARPTTNMAAARRFYLDGLGLELLGSFRDHDGFDGFMAGFRDSPWHLEITYEQGLENLPPPSRDTLVVFYVADKAEWHAVIKRMATRGFLPVPSANPYWDRNGKTFEDPDGHRIVIENAASDY